MENVLALAIEALSWIELENMSSSSALTDAAKNLGISYKGVIGEARLLVRNSLHRKNFIDRVLHLALTPASLDDYNFGVQSFLRIFTFETKFGLKSIEKAARLAEAGRAVLGWEELMPVEYALGRILRIDAKEILSNLSDYDRISLQTFYPRWFVGYCVRLMGRREALRFLSYSEPTPTYIGINTLKGREEEILEEISRSSIILDKVKDIPCLYRVVQGKEKLTKLDAYAEGLFSLQNFSSCLAAVLGEPQRGHIVVEAGVKPVRKTSYLAQLMNNTGKIFSMDSSARRVETLKREAERMGAEIVEPIVADVGRNPAIEGKADLVLLSPRCSGMGVFWREPSLKWGVDFKRVEDATDAQWTMLNKYATYVKDGGNLVYWTNSISVEENEMVIERFLRLHHEFSLVEAAPRLGLPGLRGQRECQRLYPHLHGADGSYFAKLIKN